MPIVLETLDKTPPTVSYVGILRLLETAIVAVCHDANVGEFLRQKIAEPHWAINWALSRGPTPP